MAAGLFFEPTEIDMKTIAPLLLLVGVLVFGTVVYFQYQAMGPVDENGPAKQSGLLKTEAEFRDKLTELKMQRDKAQRGIRMLEREKSKSLQTLKDKGIRSSEEFKQSDDQEVKKLVINLREYNQQISKIEKQVGYYDEAISSIRVMLDQFERDRISEEVSLSEEEQLSLQKIIIDLDERLKVDIDLLEEDELGKLLDQEMKSDDGQDTPETESE